MGRNTRGDDICAFPRVRAPCCQNHIYCATRLGGFDSFLALTYTYVWRAVLRHFFLAKLLPQRLQILCNLCPPHATQPTRVHSLDFITRFCTGSHLHRGCSPSRKGRPFRRRLSTQVSKRISPSIFITSWISGRTMTRQTWPKPTNWLFKP
eukprot:COSAG02_NODE_2352_length_9081_cov_37.519372_2_plen_151_part_00